MSDTWKRKITEQTLDRMRRKSPQEQRQEALEMARRDKLRRGLETPEPDDGDDASYQRGVLR